jgi:hypothetical protein
MRLPRAETPLARGVESICGNKARRRVFSQQPLGIEMILERYYEFGYFSCDTCHKKTRVEVEDLGQESYYCAYCGRSLHVTETTILI